MMNEQNLSGELALAVIGIAIRMTDCLLCRLRFGAHRSDRSLARILRFIGRARSKPSFSARSSARRAAESRELTSELTDA